MPIPHAIARAIPPLMAFGSELNVMATKIPMERPIIKPISNPINVGFFLSVILQSFGSYVTIKELDTTMYPKIFFKIPMTDHAVFLYEVEPIENPLEYFTESFEVVKKFIETICNILRTVEPRI